MDRSTPIAVDARTLAHEWHLRGCHHFYRGGATELEQARVWFQRALEVDPTYALAWAGLSLCCSWTFLYHRKLSPAVDEAVAAGARAVELAPSLAEARVARGLALSLEGRDMEAGDEFERALILEAELFEAHYLYGRFCFSRGLFERAESLFAGASALRPEEIQAPSMHAKSLHKLGRPEKAGEALRRALNLAERRLGMDGNDLRALANGSRALVGLGQRERGLEWASRACDLDPGNPLLYYAACARAQAADVDGALRTLEQVVDTGWADHRWLEQDGDLDPVRGEERFERMLRRLAAS